MSDETRTAAPRTKRVADPELQAMAELDRIMCELPIAALPRVLAWLVHKYAAELPEVRTALCHPSIVPEK